MCLFSFCVRHFCTASYLLFRLHLLLRQSNSSQTIFLAVVSFGLHQNAHTFMCGKLLRAMCSRIACCGTWFVESYKKTGEHRKKKRLILRANTAIFVWCGKSLPICAGKMSQKRTSKKIIESIEGKRSKEGKTHSNVMMTMMENERRIKSTTAFYFALSNKNVISYIRFYCTIYILVRLLNSIMASCMIQLSLPGCWSFVRSFFHLIFALAIGLGVPMLHRMASSPLYGKAKRKQQE